jgi:hypothetical protein
MVSNPLLIERKMRKQEILNLINEMKQDKENTMSKIVAIYSLRTGIKASTIEVYVKELRDAGLIE